MPQTKGNGQTVGAEIALVEVGDVPAQLVLDDLARLWAFGAPSESDIAARDARGIEPYIATGREPHHQSWQKYFDQEPEPPPDEASPSVKMAHKLRTAIGQAIYRLRKCTVEPVTPALVTAGASVGIIKAVLGFHQFSLPGKPLFRHTKLP